jgi:hypothetical protein
MLRITLDADMASRLLALNLEVELCDPSGRLLGRFVPLVDPAQWEPLEPDVSEEELHRREQSTEWYTAEEVLAHLKHLEKQ